MKPKACRTLGRTVHHGLFTCIFTCLLSQAPAADLHWDGQTSGGTNGTSDTWDTTTANWNPNPDFSGTAQPFTAADNVTFSGTPGTVTLATAINAGTVTFATTGYTIDTAANPTTWATLAGSSGFTKTGSSTLTLSGASSASGTVTLSAGRITLGNNTALGTSSLTLNGGTLERNAIGTVTNAITVGASGGTILGRQVVDDYTLFSGPLSGSGQLTIQGLVHLNNTSSTYAGPITISNASATYFRLGASEVLGSTTSITLAGTNARLRLDGGVTQTIASLAGSGEIFVSKVGTPAAGTLRFGNDNTNTSYTGLLTNNDGQLFLVKQGTGTFTLAPGNSNYQGLTISNGTVLATNANGGAGPTVTLGDAGTGSNNIAFLTGPNGASRPITVSNNGTGTVTIGSNTGSGSGNIVFSGTTTLNRPTTLTGGSTDRTTWTGKITGNVGTLTIAGGQRIVIEGGSNLNDFTGNIVVDGTGTVFQTGVGTGTEHLPNTASLTVNPGAVVKLAGASGSIETIDAINGSGTIRRHESVGGTQTLVIGSSNGSGTFTGTLINGAGALALVKTGTGTQTLSGNNTFSAGALIRQGSVLMRHTSALGTATITLGDASTGSNNPTVLLDTNGAAANLSTASSFNIASITGGTAVLGSTPSTPVGTRTAVFSGGITLNDDLHLRTGAGDFTTFSGNISGTGNLTVTNGSLTGDTRGNGGNRIIWSGTAKTFSGSLTVQSGTASNLTVLQINSNEMIPNTTDVTVENHAVLRLFANETIDSLSGSGRIRGVVNNYTLTVGADGGSSTFSGTMENDPFDGGSLNLAKTGTGDFTLQGTHTYTGTTTVSQGRLTLNSTIASTTSVGTGATAAELAGHGQITGNLTLGANGTLLPGKGGTADRSLTITGNVTTTAGSTLAFTIDSESAYDQLGIGGSIDLDNTNLSITLNDASFVTLAAGQGPTFLTSGASFYQLISGTTTGMFDNVTQTLSSAELTLFGLAGTQYKTNINGQSFWVAQGSTYLVAIPEPSTAILSLLASLGLLRRRR